MILSVPSHLGYGVLEALVAEESVGLPVLGDRPDSAAALAGIRVAALLGPGWRCDRVRQRTGAR